MIQRARVSCGDARSRRSANWQAHLSIRILEKAASSIRGSSFVTAFKTTRATDHTRSRRAWLKLTLGVALLRHLEKGANKVVEPRILVIRVLLCLSLGVLTPKECPIRGKKDKSLCHGIQVRPLKIIARKGDGVHLRAFHVRPPLAIGTAPRVSLPTERGKACIFVDWLACGKEAGIAVAMAIGDVEILVKFHLSAAAIVILEVSTGEVLVIVVVEHVRGRIPVATVAERAVVLVVFRDDRSSTLLTRRRAELSLLASIHRTAASKIAALGSEGAPVAALDTI